MDGWTKFFLVVGAAGVITCLVMAVRVGWTDNGLRRRMWGAEAAAAAGVFGLVWLANPGTNFAASVWLLGNAGMAGLVLWMAMGYGRPTNSGDSNWHLGIIAVTVLLYGSLVITVAVNHQDRDHGVTDQARDTALLGQKLDDAQNHVPVQQLDHRPTLADAGLAGASAERIDRSQFGPGTLTMVVNADASCVPAVVLTQAQGDTLNVLVVFQRSVFLSPVPSPSVSAADATGGLCRPPVRGGLTDTGFQSIITAVQIDLPSGPSPTTVQDASQP